MLFCTYTQSGSFIKNYETEIFSAIPADKLSGALALLSVSDNSSSPSMLKNGTASVSPDIAGIAEIFFLKSVLKTVLYQGTPDLHILIINRGK